MAIYKFGCHVDGKEAPYAYPNIWCRGETSGPDRLILAPSSNHVDLMRRLCLEMSEPFGLLYVLLVSRCGREPGRYQAAKPFSAADLAGFLDGSEVYLEGDGRHHLWIMSLPDTSQLIYDNHDVIYVYGQLDQFAGIAMERGMAQKEVRFPVPHLHRYNGEFDSEEDRIFNEYEWL